MIIDPSNPEEQASLEAYAKLVLTEKSEPEHLTDMEFIENCRYEPIPVPLAGAGITKTEPTSRLDTSTLVRFDHLQKVTKSGDFYSGTILIGVYDSEDGIVRDFWVPKKLCSNLDIDACSVYIWEVFLEGKKGALLELLKQEKVRLNDRV